MHRAKSLTVVGQDPSLRNWGLARGTYCLESRQLTIDKLELVQPVIPTGKQVRQNSLDLESSQQLYRRALAFAQGAHAVFVEVPQGSKNARAAAGYGVCMGVLGGLRASGIPFIEVTPTEVKLAGYGRKDATKQQMISWAMANHPEANWPMYRRHGVEEVSEAQAEHLADAVAAIRAGLACNTFQQMLPLLAANS